MKNRVGMPLRGIYMGRFIGRCLTFLLGVLIYIYMPEQFGVLSGMAFFKQLSVMHIIWVVWVIDMLMQLVPLRRWVPLGSQKLFAAHFRSAANAAEKREALVAYTRQQNRRAFWIAVAWGVLIAAIGVLYEKRIINEAMLLLISVAFYVCDLICVLFWCPFRVFFLRNRCCTTCRIFNWDHLMMFTPMIYLKSFYAWSLITLALLVFLVWEMEVRRHPERFWEGTNQALKCGACTDKLCMRYSKLKRQ